VSLPVEHSLVARSYPGTGKVSLVLEQHADWAFFEVCFSANSTICCLPTAGESAPNT